MSVNSSNRVIVRVWTSEANKQFPGCNVGHLALETPGCYMSLWPVPFTQKQEYEYDKAGILKQEYLRYFMPRDPNYMRSYQDDVAAEEGVEPQVVVCLYSLDVDEIEAQFEKLSQETIGWRLIGSNLLVQKLESVVDNLVQHSATMQRQATRPSTENCASFGLKLLKAGGINKLVSLPENSSFASNTSSWVSPDRILDILLPAKRAELARYPATQSFEFEGETPVTQEEDKNHCLVM